jgi:hypothetical protein
MRHLAVSILLATGFGSVAGGQQPAVPASTLEAQAILNSLYPELRTKAVAVETAKVGAAIQLRLVEPLAERQFQARDQTRRPMLVADFQFDSRNVLTSLQAAGPLLREAENTRLRSLMRAARNPDDVITAERQSFRSVTGAAVQAEAPVADLEKIIGSLSIGGVRLTSVSGESDSKYGAVWELSVTSQKVGQSQRQYAIQFEPYGGRVVGLKLQ